MKRIITIVLVIAAMLALTGCGMSKAEQEETEAQKAHEEELKQTYVGKAYLFLQRNGTEKTDSSGNTYYHVGDTIDGINYIIKGSEKYTHYIIKLPVSGQTWTVNLEQEARDDNTLELTISSYGSGDAICYIYRSTSLYPDLDIRWGAKPNSSVSSEQVEDLGRTAMKTYFSNMDDYLEDIDFPFSIKSMFD